jgi:tripartite-type tricarboxylate transporter receptor subunit TctC
VSVPAAVPRPIVERLNRDIGDYLRSPAAQAKFAPAGHEFIPGSPEEMTARIKAEIPVSAKLMRSVGIEPE